MAQGIRNIFCLSGDHQQFGNHLMAKGVFDKEIPGVRGIHVTAVGWEEIVPTIAEKAGLLPRPVL